MAQDADTARRLAANRTAVKAVAGPGAYVAPEALRHEEKEINTLLKRIGHTRLEDGRTPVEVLRTGPTSLWWFVEPALHRYHLKHLGRHLLWLDAATDAEGATGLRFHDDGSPLALAARAVADHRRLTLDPVPAVPVAQPRGAPRHLVAFARDIVRAVLAPALGPQGSGTGPVLVASMAREQISIDAATGAVVPEDLIVEPILARLRERPEVAAVRLYKYPDGRRLRVPASALRGPVAAGVATWERALGTAGRLEVVRLHRQVSRALRQLLEDSRFREAWSYRGMPIWDAVRPGLVRAFKVELPASLPALAAAPRLLDRVRPRALLVASETSADNKALIAEAHARGLPVVALQHGSILATDDYLVDLSASAEDLSAGKARLFPDEFCVFGPATRSVLADIGYPFPERVVETGQPRFDALLDPVEPRERAAFQRAFHLLDLPILLVGSQTFHIGGGKEAFWEAILGELGGKPDVSLVVKPHPLEDAAAIAARAQARGVQLTVLPSNFRMATAIRACDIFLTAYSTVGIEAMAARKPVIVLNLTGNPDPHTWVASGAAAGVYAAADLRPTVARLLDPAARAALAAGAEKLIAHELGARQKTAATDAVLARVLARAGG